ncbi:MAG: DUF2726 domain-containing protein [Verrucomicrobiota bacterium]
MESIIVPAVIIALIFLAISFKDVIASTFKGSLTAANKQENRFVSQALFTPAERSFLGVIDKAIDGQYRVMGKVRLADLITTVKGMNASERQKAFNKITGKHLDFVVCRVSDLVPVVAIELDDKSHNSKTRIERDKFIEQALSSAGIPLVRYKAQRQYNTEAVLNKLTPFLTELPTEMHQSYSDESTPKTTESSTTTEDSQENLICPRCSSQLVKRIAKKGEKKGTEFYGCAAFPKCQYMKEIC